MRSITITPVLNGFVVKCGCQTVVFTSIEAMSTTIQEYYKNPGEMERRYLEESINAAYLAHVVLVDEDAREEEPDLSEYDAGDDIRCVRGGFMQE